MTSDAEQHRYLPRSRPLTLGELGEELLWPKLLRAARVALRPAQIGMAAVALLLVGLIGQLSLIWSDGPDFWTRAIALYAGAVGELYLEALALRPAGVVAAGGELLVGVPAALWSQDWPSVLLLGPPTLAVLAIAGGAIARLASLELAQGVRLAWPGALGFALSRWFGLTASLLVPLLFVLFLSGAIALAGWLLFVLPGVNVVGAVLLPVLLIVAIVAVVSMLIVALGWPMLPPAVACEGTDGIDAVQRVAAYVLHRPLRLALYLLILLLLGIVLVALAGGIAGGAAMLVQNAAAWLLPAERAVVLSGSSAELEGVDRVAARIVGVWLNVLALLVSGVAYSYIFCAGSALYLAMRRIVDGQEVSDLWMPTLVPATQTPAAPEPAPSAPPPGEA